MAERIRMQLLDRPRRRRWLVLKPRLDRCFQHPLLARRQRPKLAVGVLRDNDVKPHRGILHPSALNCTMS